MCHENLQTGHLRLAFPVWENILQLRHLEKIHGQKHSGAILLVKHLGRGLTAKHCVQNETNLKPTWFDS